MIDWTNSEFIIPRKTTSRQSIITADIDSIGTKKDLKKTIDIIAQAVADYNVYHSYSQLSGNPLKSNCQDFVEELLERLEIKLNFEGAMGNYLKELRTKGQGKLKFKPDKEFIQKFLLKDESVIFISHDQLDTFVRNLMKIDSKFKKNYPSEFSLLKSFDR